MELITSIKSVILKRVESGSLNGSPSSPNHSLEAVCEQMINTKYSNHHFDSMVDGTTFLFLQIIQSPEIPMVMFKISSMKWKTYMLANNNEVTVSILKIHRSVDPFNVLVHVLNFFRQNSTQLCIKGNPSI